MTADEPLSKINAQGDRRQTVFRGVSDADCIRQAERDAVLARENGYSPESQSWTDDMGLRVLTVIYRRMYGAPTSGGYAPAAVTGARHPDTVWAAIGAVAGVVIVVAAFLPWISVTAAFVGTVTRNGIDGGGDGWFAVVLGAVIALLGINGATRDPSRVRTALIVFGLIVVVAAVFEAFSVQNRIEEMDATIRPLASVGLGIIVGGIGGAVATLAGFRIGRS